MNNIIFVTSRLDANHGGLTASMLNKAKLFYDENEIKSKILTFHADPKFNSVKEDIIKRYNLENKTTVYNINEFYRERNLSYPKIKHRINTDDYMPVKRTENVIEFYKDGLKKIEIFYKKSNKISEIKYFSNNNICSQKDILDEEGYLFWRSYYLDSYLAKQVFYRKDKTAFLTRDFDAIHKSDKIINIVLFENNTIFFKTFNDFKEHFIKEFINSSCTYLIGEARGLDPVIINLDDSRVKKIIMTHSIHIRPDTDIIRTGNRATLNNLNHIDALVLLTEKQRDDIIRRFGYRNNYYVIPHSINLPNIVKSKENNKVVIISRLHEEKRIDHSIKAFKEVVNKIPNAKLDIYGEGKEKAKLQSLINELNLENNIKLKGYTDESNLVLQSSDCSLLTSKYEGFAISIQESIAAGTPVISYNIKYGPSDMIEHGKNGYLVQDGNIDQLSQHIIKYLKKSDHEKESFSKDSREKAKFFTNEKFVKSWMDLFDNVRKEKTKFNPSIKLLNVKRTKFKKNNYKIYIEVDLESQEYIYPEFQANCYYRSSLKDNENKKNAPLKMNILNNHNNIYLLEVVFNGKKLEREEIYDLSLTVQYKTQYFDIRIGNNREINSISHLKSKKVIPYFTKSHENLSFEIL